MDADGAAGDADGPPAPKRRAYDNVSGRVSGRPWKAQFTRASAQAVKPPGDWAAKMAEKKQKRALQARALALPARAAGRRRLGAARSLR